MNKTLIFFLLTAFFAWNLNFCQSLELQQLSYEDFGNPAEKRNITWQLKSIDNKLIASENSPQLHFLGSEAGFYGGCNGGGGKVKLGKGSIKFSDVFMTSKACDQEILKLETLYYQFINSATSYRLMNHELILSDQKQEFLFVKKPQIPNAQLSATQWHLVAISVMDGMAVSSLMRDTYLEMRIENGQMTVKTDCGDFTVNIKLQNESFKFLSFVSENSRSCEDANRMQAQKFKDDLQKVKLYQIKQNRLVLKQDSKGFLYEFEAGK